MKYNELPKWAQMQAKEWAKEQFLQMDEEARRGGEDVPYYTESELEEVITEHLNEDSFTIEYNEDGEAELFY